MVAVLGRILVVGSSSAFWPGWVLLAPRCRGRPTPGGDHDKRSDVIIRDDPGLLSDLRTLDLVLSAVYEPLTMTASASITGYAVVVGASR